MTAGTYVVSLRVPALQDAEYQNDHKVSLRKVSWAFGGFGECADAASPSHLPLRTAIGDNMAQLGATATTTHARVYMGDDEDDEVVE